jgi:hypothetical protein
LVGYCWLAYHADHLIMCYRILVTHVINVKAYFNHRHTQTIVATTLSPQ